MCRIRRMPSESKTVSSLKSTSGMRAGVEPGARTIFSAVSRRSAPEPSSTSIACSSTKNAVPSTSATRLRTSWSRTTSRSRSTTWRVRVRRSSTEIWSRQAVAPAVDLALVEAGQVDDRLANRLRRDRARVDGDPAERARPLDERDSAAQLGRLDRRLLTRRPGADHEDVVVVAHWPWAMISARAGISGDRRCVRAVTTGGVCPAQATTDPHR